MSATEINKIIIVNSCIVCPLVSSCPTWKKLTPKQKFTLKFGVGIGNFILKGCPLNDYIKPKTPKK